MPCAWCHRHLAPFGEQVQAMHGSDFIIVLLSIMATVFGSLSVYGLKFGRLPAKRGGWVRKEDAPLLFPAAVAGYASVAVAAAAVAFRLWMNQG